MTDIQLATAPRQKTPSKLSHYLQPKSTANHAAPLGPNPLVGAAGKLFAILNQLKQDQQHQHADSLKQYILTELNLFTQQVQQFNYHNDSILVSQYVICQCFDNSILASQWGKLVDWKQHLLVDALPHAQSIAEHFASATKRMCEQADNFIDVLELIYICLSLTDSSHINKETYPLKTNDLYDVIKSQRGEFEKRLSPKTKVRSSIKKSQKKRTPWLMISATIIVIVGMYIGFNSALKQPVQTSLNSTTQIQHG